ncbi:MAG TPA: sigma-70 family RNA polymerase sigma factor [Planctomycetota bacterium]|nr:sigma-70 family RNA polymerase sigma factor [Planctomycetota bacterium]
MGNWGTILLEADLPATGDESFERLCQELRPRAFKFATGMVPDHSRAEELLQEALLRLHSARGRYAETSDDVRRYLFRILANLCLDELRRGRVGGEVLAEARPLERLRRERQQAAPDAALGRRERAAAVEEALGRLPGPERAALLLREIEGLSYAQIAQSLGTSVSDVNNLIHRARGRFAELMRPWME